MLCHLGQTQCNIWARSSSHIWVRPSPISQPSSASARVPPRLCDPLRLNRRYTHASIVPIGVTSGKCSVLPFQDTLSEHSNGTRFALLEFSLAWRVLSCRAGN